MEDNEQPPAPITEASAPKVVERPLWELSRDEQRILIITFVGGLASIVAGVCVVGGAIALVRGLRALHYPLWLVAVLTAVYIFALVWVVNFRRRVQGLASRLVSILLLALCVWLS